MSKNLITVLIADDELHARKRLKTLLNDHPIFKIVSEAENGDQVVSEIIIQKPQIVFLDINMPGASVFNTIPLLEHPPLVIFQTAYSEYGVKAFDINAIDYLLKPVSRDRFSQAINKVSKILDKEEQKDIKLNPQNKDVISVKSGEIIKIVKLQKISRISFEDGFSFIYVGTDKLYSDKSLNYYDDTLETSGFYRISRADIINISYINKLHPMFKGQYIVEMLNGDKIKISRRRIQGLKELVI